ncbi:MAG: hypothetical protein ACOX0A_10765 [Thermoguttaceae bacterium]|jgi:hypothetical protein
MTLASAKKIMRLRKHRASVAVSLCAALFVALCLTDAVDAASHEEQIRARANEIVAILDDTTGAKMAPRKQWERFANAPNAPLIFKNAENVLKNDPPEITEDLYKEYSRTGVRSNYATAYNNWQNRITFLTLAEGIEDKGRFIDALNVELDRFCDLTSWVLPIHDKRNEVYDGKVVFSDLGATLAAATVAVAVNLFEDKLDPRVVAKAKGEIERRVLEPYEKAVDNPSGGMWWLQSLNNWSAVCHAGTVVAALNVVESKERRAFFVAGAEYFLQRYFYEGFTNDGYCYEGLGYWNYGFGHYLCLGAAVRNATQGRLDFFRFPKTRAILDFAPTIEIDKGIYPSFSDCPENASPNPVFIGYLSRLKGYGYTDFEARSLGDAFQIGELIRSTTIGFDSEVVFPEVPPEPKEYAPPIRTEFADASVFVCRPAKDAKGEYFAIAFKGGDNGEFHNHNDLGAYTLLFGTNADPDAPGVFVSRDPGAEIYSPRTFNSRRYEGELLNSFGHPVPRIAGKLQKEGKDSRAFVERKSFTDDEDVVTLDITSAYPEVENLAKAQRTFLYRRASGDDPGFVTIADSVIFKNGARGAFETAIITREKEIDVESTSDGGLTLRFANVVLTATAKDASGAALTLKAERAVVGEKDEFVKNKPTRIALRVDGDVNNATIEQRFSAEKEAAR